jgi:hypothetical protein
VLGNEPLRTKIIKETHNSLLVGHLGREITYKMLVRDYFWLGMLNDVWKFVRNCDVYGRTKL